MRVPNTMSVDCPCGNPVPVRFTLGAPAPAIDGKVSIDLALVGYEETWEWHARRFHNGPRGGPGLPLEVAA